MSGGMSWGRIALFTAAVIAGAALGIAAFPFGGAR